ncbi:MAG: mechanosensitive ion channel family protein [Microcystaceae cyanobacterium]
MNTKWIKFIVINLLAILMVLGSVTFPSFVKAQIFSNPSQTIWGNIAVAPVKLDGNILFEVASPIALAEQSENNPIHSVQQRVERIEKTLHTLLRNSDSNTLKIDISTLNNQTIIIASDAKQIRKITIVTITELDAQLNAVPIPELAEQWSVTTYNALIKAWQERKPKWLLRQSLITLVSLFILVSLSKVFTVFLKRFRQQSTSTQIEQESLKLLKYWFLPIALLILWLPSISLILRLFPYTREWGILFLNSAVSLSIALFIFLVIGKIVDIIYKQYKPSDSYQRIAFKTVTELTWILIINVFLIFIIAILFNQPPLNILAGFGAAGAVFLLMSQDSLKGFIAGLELAGNKMVALGDWIEMPQYQVNGDVIDISLLIVKVRNRDQSIVSIPSYAMVSESFINWKAMQNTGARRIMRGVYIDVNTIKFCSEQLMGKLKQNSLLTDTIFTQQVTNLELFQTYVKSYLRSHPQIHQDLFLIVRQLAPHQYGVPIEIYCFTKKTNLEDYEAVQSEIFNHIFSVVNEFELKLFQSPSGEDLQRLF